MNESTSTKAPKAFVFNFSRCKICPTKTQQLATYIKLVQQLEKHVHELTNVNENLKRNVSGLQETLEKERKTLSEKENSIKGLHLELEISTTENTRLQREVRTKLTQSRAKPDDQTVRKLRNELFTTKSKLKERQESIATKDQEIRALKDKNESLERERATLLSDKRDLDKMQSQHAEDIRKVHIELEEATRKFGESGITKKQLSLIKDLVDILDFRTSIANPRNPLIHPPTLQIDKCSLDVLSVIRGPVRGFLQLFPLVHPSEFEETAIQYFDGNKFEPSRLSSLVSSLVAFHSPEKTTFLELYGYAQKFLEADKTPSGPLKTACVYFTTNCCLTFIDRAQGCQLLKSHVNAGLLKWVPSSNTETCPPDRSLRSLHRAQTWIYAAILYMEVCQRTNDDMRIVAQKIRGYLELKPFSVDNDDAYRLLLSILNFGLDIYEITWDDPRADRGQVIQKMLGKFTMIKQELARRKLLSVDSILKAQLEMWSLWCNQFCIILLSNREGFRLNLEENVKAAIGNLSYLRNEARALDYVPPRTLLKKSSRRDCIQMFLSYEPWITGHPVSTGYFPMSDKSSYPCLSDIDYLESLNSFDRLMNAMEERTIGDVLEESVRNPVRFVDVPRSE